MDEVDRLIINALQGGFPVCARPYAVAAGEIGIDEDELIARLGQMLGDKTLSRFGPLYDTEKLGGAVTLAAMEVPTDRFDAVAKTVNEFVEVAHNYERDHRLNMWFVIAAADPARISRVIAEIEAQTRLTVLDMPKSEEYFLELKLSL